MLQAILHRINRGSPFQKGIHLFFLFLALTLFGACDDNFDTALKNEIEASTDPAPQPEPEPEPEPEGNFTWQKIGNVAIPLSGAAAAVHNGSLYIHGGVNSSGDVEDVLYKVDLATGTTVSSTTTWARAYHSMTAVNGLLYIFGGADETGAGTNLLAGYDPDTGTWDEITTSETNGSWPDGRSRHTAFAWEDNLYIYGGNLAGEIGTTLLAAVSDPVLYCLDFYGNTANGKHVWSEVTSIEGRAGHGSVVIGDILHIAGGFSPNDSTLFKNIWTYDLITGTGNEILLDTTLYQRKNISLAAIGDSFFTFSGEGSDGIDSLFVGGTAAGDYSSWTGEAEGRSEYVLESDGTSLYLFGGRNASTSQYFNDLWVITPKE